MRLRRLRPWRLPIAGVGAGRRSNRSTRSPPGFAARLARASGSREPRREAPALEYIGRSSACARVVRLMPMRARARRGTLLGLAVLHVRPGRTGGSRRRNLAAAFPDRSGGGAARDRARDVRAFRPPAVRAAEVQHAVAGARCSRASSSKARSACAPAYAQGKGVLFFTGHFGFWELQRMVHALRIEPIGRARARARQPAAQRLLERIRQRTGNTVIYRQRRRSAA